MVYLAFSPLVSMAVFWCLVAGTVLLSLYALLARGPWALLRIPALAFILAALANPSWIREERDMLKSVVAVIVDRSGSQRLGDRVAMTEQALETVKKRIAALPVETRIVDVGDSGADEGTRLFTALQNGLSDVSPERLAGVIVLTDGVIHDIPALPGFRGPLHALITGHETERDRQIALIEAPRFGFVGRDVTIKAEVRERGGSGQAQIRLRRDGQPVLEQQVATNRPFSLNLRIEHGGENVVEIETEALTDELTLANNSAVLDIEGVREKLRVLLVSGEPHAGERTWRNLLKSDANVDLVHFTILRPPEKQDGTPINELSLIAFPTRELFQVKIKEFDLIIFDRYANQSILPSIYYDSIISYVREGGAVLVAAGPEYASFSSLARTKLAEILPALPDGRIREEPYRPELTLQGRRHPVTRDLQGTSDFASPNWGEWLRLIGSEGARGMVAMQGLGRPLLILNHEEQGRVALLLSDHAWLWARGFQGGGPHVELLRRLSHWLMKEPALEEEALRASARGNDIRIERQSLSMEAGDAVVKAPSGKEFVVGLKEERPGLFTARISSDEQGLHTIVSGSLRAFVSIGPANSRELADVFSTTELLEPLAQSSGGSARRLDQKGQITVPEIRLASGNRFSGASWIGLKPSEAAITRGISSFSLTLGFLGLSLLLGGVLAAWIGEGRKG